MSSTPAPCRCGHDSITHTMRLAFGVPGGLVYGECFAAARSYECDCPQYDPPPER